MRHIPWSEIARHNNSRDCWIVVDGSVYDVTAWIAKHPGGEVIAALAGEDASHLVHSSHLGDISGMLSRLKIGEVSEYQPPFQNLSDDFLCTLKRRVAGYFADHGIDRRNTPRNSRSIDISAMLLVCCWTCICLLPPWGTLAAIPMGLVTCALIGAFGHEQIHGNLLRKPGILSDIKDAVRWGLFIPFMPKCYFQYEHLKHHASPMHPDHDYDVYALQYLVRLNPHTPLHRHHSLQHLYAPFVYANYIVLQLIGGYFTPFFDARSLLKERRMVMHIIVSSITAFTFHIAAPIYLAGLEWGLLSIAMYFITWQAAIYISSGLPHMTRTPDSHNMPFSWSRYICDTTVNLKCGNKFCDWLTGGLNYHLVHHLLPTVSREYLPDIYPIVERTCAEYGYPFKTYASFRHYYLDHYNMLVELGRSRESARTGAAGTLQHSTASTQSD